MKWKNLLAWKKGVTWEKNNKEKQNYGQGGIT
jgi:hypothetical protein